MKEKDDSKYKRFIETAFREVKLVLHKYSGRFSKKTYTQHQHAVAILLMKYENKTYRDITELLTELRGYFGYGRSAPHFTTLQKFFERIPPRVWDSLLARTYWMFMNTVANVAIDSTGYKLHHASQHYEYVTGVQTRRKRFMKHIISVDTDRQAIIASESRRSYVHDSKTFCPILQETGNTVGINRVTADRGYDSEKNHRFARKELGAESIIPLKHVVPLSRTTGFYRRKLRRNFPYSEYHQRSKIETINSVQKRKFGDELRSRLLKTQRKEMKVVDVTYNLYRYLNHYLSVFIGFLQSQ